MKRRKALKSLGWGLSAGLILPEFLASCKKDESGPEIKYSGTIGVIGAGAAGLYVADILRSKGVKVVILEAGNELGGRIKSLRNQTNIASTSIADFPVELGAEITYGSDSIWGKIFQNLNVPRVDLATSTDLFILESQVKSKSDWGSDADLMAVQNFIAGLPNFSGPGVSVLDAAGVSPRAQPLLNSQVGNFYGSTSSQVGAQGIAQQTKAINHNSTWLTTKANPLQDLLLSRFSLVTPKALLNHAVDKIDYNGTKVTLSGQDLSGATPAPFSMDVDKVIVTVPISILKAGQIAFTPALPSSMTGAMANLGMDASVRIVLDFKKNFWGKGTGIIWGGTQGPQYFNAGTGRSEFENTLSITINGPKAAELSAMGADMINPILAELDSIYSNQASLYIRRDLDTNQPLSTIQDWSKETYIQGGYSYPLLNATMDDRKQIRTQLDNQGGVVTVRDAQTDKIVVGSPKTGVVFFAGEATDYFGGDAGTVNGALASAEHVADEVAFSLVP